MDEVLWRLEQEVGRNIQEGESKVRDLFSYIQPTAEVSEQALPAELRDIGFSTTWSVLGACNFELIHFCLGFTCRSCLVKLIADGEVTDPTLGVYPTEPPVLLLVPDRDGRLAKRRP